MMATTSSPSPGLSRARWRGRLVCAALALLLSAPAGVAETQPEDFQLQPRTRIKLVVLEWIPATGEYKDWNTVSGEYVVSPAGNLDLPLAGMIEVGSHTSTEMAQAIAARLRERTGLVKAPETSVQIVAYPPVFVVGRVSRPGEYAFTPGLTVLQTFALAGGRERATDYGVLSISEQIRYIGELDRLEAELPRLKMRHARLLAELEGKEAFPQPADNSTPASVRLTAIYEAEEQLFEARRDTFNRQVATLAELGALLDREIETLAGKETSQQRQIKIAKDDLAAINSLVKQGTATRPRQSELERLLASLESDMLDIKLASMRASQRVSETRREIETLKGERANQVTRERQEVEGEIEQTELRVSNTRAVLIAAGSELESQQNKANASDASLIFSIIHPGQAQAVRTDENAIMSPGDVLRVELDVGRDRKAGMQQQTSASKPGSPQW